MERNYYKIKGSDDFVDIIKQGLIPIFLSDYDIHNNYDLPELLVIKNKEQESRLINLLNNPINYKRIILFLQQEYIKD